MQVRGAKKQQSSVVYRNRSNSWTLSTEEEDEEEVLAEVDGATKELAEEVAEDLPDRIPPTRRQTCQRCNGSCK